MTKRTDFHLAYLLVLIYHSSTSSAAAHYRPNIGCIIFSPNTKNLCGSALSLARIGKNNRCRINGSSKQALERGRPEVLRLRGGSSYSGDSGKGYYGDYRGDNNKADDYYGSSSRDDSYYSDRPDYEEERYYQEDRYERNDRHDERDDNYRDDYSNSPRKSYRSRSSSSSSSFLPSSLPGIIKPNRKLGFTCLASGTAITFLGITLFFNKTLLRLGNVLFLLGIPLTIGPGRTMGYFLQPKKARATSCLVCGVFLVLVGYPVFGIALEIFGLLNLFGNMFPVLLMFLRSLPVVGDLFPDGKKKKKGKSSRDRRSYDDNDYDEGYYDQSNRNAEQYY